MSKTTEPKKEKEVAPEPKKEKRAWVAPVIVKVNLKEATLQGSGTLCDTNPGSPGCSALDPFNENPMGN